MPLKHIKTADTIRFDFEGRMDTIGSNDADLELEKAIFQIDETELSGIKITFDLKNVSFVSSAFMRICLKFAKKAGKDKFELINTNLNIKKTFKIAGLDKVLNIL